MSYTALYRKWRPLIFDEVVGQDQIIQTIRSQVKNKSMPHAYLFSGTRGTGKTSTAKILSRAVNCLTPDGENPCNHCEICKGILDESLMDIIEIDAASNNGVDDVRELRENVKYPPSKAAYKVYIIDEVHMLSTGAFNALLKTLEEPPHYVIFILATTEPHKIPATILSRCQRFDFKRVSKEANKERMGYILDQMSVDYDLEAIELIIQNADGAVRDALSLLDKCVDGEGQTLTLEHAMECMGLVMDDVLFDFSAAMIEKDAEALFSQIDRLHENGKDLTQFLKRLIVHFRNYMMVKVGADVTRMVNESDKYIDQMMVQSASTSVHTLIRWINILSGLENELKWTSQGRILFEVAIAKLIHPVYDTSYEALLERLEILEKGAINSAPIQVATATKSVPEMKAPEVKAPVPTKAAMPSEPSLEPEVTKAKTPESPNVESFPSGTLNSEEFRRIQGAWQQLLVAVKDRNVRVHAFLIEGAPKAIQNGELLIGFDDIFGFHVDMLSRAENRSLVEQIVSGFLQKSVAVKCVFNSSLSLEEEVSNDEPTDDVEAIKAFLGDASDKMEIIE
ncbi:MAG: DNA polymerase III subunit gamma/tau [Clostridia bacterium]|nr:DNA polymerase III subunit gamma/tau [Clostridia bacterium]